MNAKTLFVALLPLSSVIACSGVDAQPQQTNGTGTQLTRAADAKNLLENGDLESSEASETGWAVSGGAHAGYALTPSTTEKHGGRASGLLAPIAGPVEGYATVMQAADATSVRGKHVHAQIWARLEGTFSRTDFWIRARNGAGGDGPMLGAKGTKLEANGEWKRYDLELDIPENANKIDFGAGVVGDGKLWIDDAVLVEGDAPPPSAFALENGDLESGTTAPSGWYLDGNGRSTYDLVRTNEAHGGKSAGQIRKKTPDAAGYATAAQMLDARTVRGKHVRLTVWARTEGATGRVDVWTRARAEGQAGDGPMLGADAKKPAADSAWTAYTLEIDVPTSARYLDFGIGIAGPGTIWFDDASVEAR